MCIPLCRRCHALIEATRPPALWGGLAWAAVWTPGVGLTLVRGPEELETLSPDELRAHVRKTLCLYAQEHLAERSEPCQDP